MTMRETITLKRRLREQVNQLVRKDKTLLRMKTTTRKKPTWRQKTKFLKQRMRMLRRITQIQMAI